MALGKDKFILIVDLYTDYKSTGGDNFLTQEQQKKIPHSFKKIKGIFLIYISHEIYL